MTVKRKILLVSITTSFAFWIPIWLPFAQKIGVDINTAYGIIAFYSLLVVLLEYPTGVIGDTYSHKLSIFVGFLALAISSVSMAFSTGFTSLTLSIALFALGTSTISGSDQAYFKSILGKDFRAFYPTMKNTAIVSTLLGVSLGSFLYSWHYMLPLLLNAVSFGIAAIILAFLPKEQHSASDIIENANPIKVASRGIQVLIKTASLRNLLIIYAIIFAFSNNLKWLYGNILDLVNLPVSYWGALIALFYFGKVIGVQLQHRIKGKKNLTALLIALANLVFVLGFIYSTLLLPIVVFLVMIVIGAIETELELDIQENTPDSVRSSILSLKSLLGRGSAALYISLAGVLATSDSISKLTLATFALILFAVGVQISQYIKQKEA